MNEKLISQLQLNLADLNQVYSSASSQNFAKIGVMYDCYRRKKNRIGENERWKKDTVFFFFFLKKYIEVLSEETELKPCWEQLGMARRSRSFYASDPQIQLLTSTLQNGGEETDKTDRQVEVNIKTKFNPQILHLTSLSSQATKPLKPQPNPEAQSRVTKYGDEQDKTY